MSEPDAQAVDALLERLIDADGAERARVLDDPDLDPALRERVKRLLKHIDVPPPELEDLGLRRQTVEALTHPPSIGPYVISGVLGSGGAGVVYRAHQQNPDRAVAVKVLRATFEGEREAWRFQQEAQLLGRLQHPGIAQIFESGQTVLDGRPTNFIAMEFVDGLPITDYVREARWNRAQTVELLAQVAEAVHHAHMRAVVHRDIKPMNVLVSREGRVKVIDFGVARALDRANGATLETQMGQVIGTLAYMSPEQVSGQVDAIDARTDVYALGVLAYEVLSGQLPHRLSGLTLATAAARICEEPPSHLGTHAADCKGDLEWVVGKALAKAVDRRYDSASAFAADLRRWLRSEPIEARPESGFYRFSKLVQRHRSAFAGALATLLTIVVGALVAVHYAIENTALARREAAARAIANDQALGAERLRRLAEERADEIIRRTDPGQLAEIIREADGLWPAAPATVPAMDRWLQSSAEPIAARLPLHTEWLEQLRARAAPYSEEERAADRAENTARIERLQAELERVRSERAGEAAAIPVPTEQQHDVLAGYERDILAEIAALEDGPVPRRTWTFSEPEGQRAHDALASLVSELALFADPESGLLAEVRARRERALTLEVRTVTDPEPAAEWANAIASIEGAPAYGGLRIEPMPGLRPLGQDPQSGLWEFWHLESGARPRPSEAGRGPGAWAIDASTGLVFALVPGGHRALGSQALDPNAPNYDPQRTSQDGPAREVVLEPFLLSRYEMTQAQWRRLENESPSLYTETFTWFGMPAGEAALQVNTPWNPVEQVTYVRATEALSRAGLRLPTLDEWECAARGGTDTPWWTGADVSSLGSRVPGNLADDRSRSFGAPTHWEFQPWPDAWCTHAPVGSFPANRYGFHDTIGNVLEYCAMENISGVPNQVAPVVGGSYDEGAGKARVTYRGFVRSVDNSAKVGIRPALSLPQE